MPLDAEHLVGICTDHYGMFRLARLGDVYPIGSSTGQVNVGGRNWDLWVGDNGAMKVFSFIAPSPITSYSGDLKNFYTYITNNQGFPASSQYLISMSQPPLSNRVVHALTV